MSTLGETRTRQFTAELESLAYLAPSCTRTVWCPWHSWVVSEVWTSPRRTAQSRVLLTHRSISVPEVPVVGVSVWVPVVVGNGHIIQTVMLRWRWSGVRQTIGLVRQAVIWTVPLAWANSAGPLAWMLWVQRLSVKAIFFGSGRERGQRKTGQSLRREMDTNTELTHLFMETFQTLLSSGRHTIHVSTHAFVLKVSSSHIINW